MPTIHDVAERAGVSVKTVSRVLNDYPHISAGTRTKVTDAIEALNFSPSRIAREMRLGDSLSIGMVYVDASSGYQAQLNHSMMKACADAQRYLAVELYNEKDPDLVTQVERFLDRTKVKNMVLVPPLCDSLDVQRMLQDRGIGFVLISPTHALENVKTVAMDDHQAAYEITTHLLSLGHRRIVHITGNPDHRATSQREAGFLSAMKDAGLSLPRDEAVFEGGFHFKRAMDCADEFLSWKDRPTAVFAANDQMAVATLMMAQKQGMVCPDDLSVVGFDNTDLAQSVWPALTTVAQPFDAFAAEAVAMLAGSNDGADQTTNHAVLPFELIIRQSTGPVSTQ